MKVEIVPGKTSFNRVQIPCSKSMAHRAIICASLAKGKSVISNVHFSEDIGTTIEAMKKLGAKIERKENQVIVEGIQSFDQLSSKDIECNESGSTLRFLIPIFSLTNQKVRFIGKNRLLKRPQDIYKQIFMNQGNDFKQTEDYIEICGKIKPGKITLPGNVSSQFISGLLFTLPLCNEDSELQIVAPFESRSYVLLTIEMLEKFNVHVYFKDENTLYIPGNQSYCPFDETIEGDYSQLSFFAVLGAINNGMECIGVRKDSLQGDKKIVDILKSMNVEVIETETGLIFKKSNLKGTLIDLADCPDLGPILMTAASFAEGETKIIHASRLRLKESDRIAAMEEELRKMGVDIQSDEDTVILHGPTCWKGNEELCGHKDHRIVMSLAVGSTVSMQNNVINQAESIKKSYPTFFEDLEMQGITLKEWNE